MSKWQEMAVKITTLSPVLVAARSAAGTMTASHDYFSGTIVRGILAGRYIECRHLEQAEEDEGFRELFFSELNFGAAYPMLAGQRSLVLPLSLQRSKDGSRVISLLNEQGEAGYKALRGLGVVSEGQITPVTVKKNISLHMSRSDLRQGDGSERLAGRSLDGGIFNYEAIESGQEFCGFVWGEHSQLQRLREALDGGQWEARIGRSRFTQYGRCGISLGEICDLPAPVQEGTDGRVFLRLDSSFLPEAETEDALAALSVLPRRLKELTGADFSLEEHTIFARRETVDNFVGVWNMKRPREEALAAGSVFALQKKSPWGEADRTALQQVMYEGIGRRRSEGFGQLRLWTAEKLKMAPASQAEALPARQVKNVSVRQKALEIIGSRILADMQNFAAEDAWEARSYLGESGRHFLSRLETVLQNAEGRGGLEAFREELSIEVKGPATPFAKALSSIRIHGKNLRSFWAEEQDYGDMPYWQEERRQALVPEKMQQALKDLGVEQGVEYFRDSRQLFYAYWRWFCRYGRKYASKADA